MKNSDMPAMATITKTHPSYDKQEQGVFYHETEGGLTKREKFAAMAMQGYIASVGIVGGISPSDEDMARYSVEMADALLAELERTS